MSRLGNIAVWLFAAVFLGLGLTIAGAADRSIELVPQVDLPGFDYAVSKNVSLGQCQSACVDDRACQAFTFNEKAKWCFLKGAAAAPVAFKGATSGRIVSSPTLDELYEQRIRDLSFSAMGLIEGARSFASGLPSTDPAPEGFGYHDLVTEADAAMAEGNAAGARVFLRQALGINGNDPATWIKLASASLSAYNAAVAANGRGDYEIATDITYAGLNAFLKSEPTRERATALAYLARGLEGREMWREAIATYRDSLELVDDAALAARLDTVVAEHGFRVVSHEIDAESAQPRICAVFSDPLASGDVDLASFVSVAGNPRLAVEREDNQLCLEGVMHGARYHVTLRAGLPSSDGEELRNTVELDLYVPDRSPFVGFANNAYVMPAGLGGGLPMTSVNATSADVAIYRIGDRAIAAAVRDGVFRQTLDNYSAEDIAFRTGQLAFEGTVDLAAAALNEMGVTAIPVADMLGELAPGAYVITAKVTDAEEDYWSELATQWFIVTDLGLSVVSGNDGIHAFARSLTGTEPVAGASVRLVAVNNEILGEAVTDENGRADFAPGLGRGDGGMAPQLLVAETDAGDYAFLDLGRPAFDLSDRGVTGRPTAGPLDLFATTERGVYRPGETVFLTALLRDSRAEAVTGLPLTLQFERPDGILSSSETVTDLGAGSYFTALDLRSNAMRGSWHARLFADPKAQPLADISFLVQDFEPERLAFDISAPEGMVSEDAPLPVSVVARYLYGATAPNLSIEADAILRPRTTLPDYPGYTFGREDDTVQTDQIPLGIIAATDQSGEAVADVYLPEPMPSTRPLDAQIVMRLIDSNGRPVTRSLTRPVMATTDRIGISPAFKGSELGEGSEAGFDIITVAPDGALAARTGLEWTLSRITTTYQWYRTGGTWKWEAITTTSRVANGSVDTAETGAVRVSAPVDWGRYLFEIETTGDNPTSSSQSFYAGYYYAEAGSDTPDTLDVALDKKAYAVGETAVLRLEPQFAGTALVLVVDDRIIDMQAVDVPEGGTSVSLPVTADWGPGAYVTAMLYRPADAGEKRMPARAVGLAFADVDPGERLIGLALDVPEEALPREAFTATVDVGAAAAGTRAYVAVAAVDLGILNLTGFETPDPDGWFYGQRQLGVDIRDLYGQLIDPTQGLPGAFRSGGDGMGGSGAPPPTSVLVALHSGIVTVGDDGTASVEFDMPDFNGTVRVMAMAWTDNAVGHAEKDVVVHDPVVVTLSPPRFLRVDDSARLLVEIANVSGEEGGYAVELTTGNGLSADVGNRSFELAAGGRVALDFVLTGKEIGDHDLRLLLTDPSGNALVKTLTLGVRPTSVATTTTVTWPIEPGASIDVDNGYFAGLLPGTGTLTLAVGPLARLNVPELLLALDRYPYGCAEQVTSRALPLLYLNDVAGMIGLGEDGEIDGRVRSAIADLMSKQTYSGGFGLWGPFSYTEMWLDGYVTDFLLRAKSAGYDVPADGLERALDNLGNQVSYASDFDFGGEDIAYALYDLARAGRASIGDLR
ncbi:MAG: alpha-2-macroglobulin family protein [Alphaproteobacteria bacterium]|nr:alpha-2-macroglobulin family protein [Alphaproteobacteria bacterium]